MKRLLIILMAMALAAAACGGGDSSGLVDAAAACGVDEVDGDLDLYNWSDYIDPELVSAFEADYTVTVNEGFYDSNEAMLPQIESGGNDYDLIVPSDYTVTIMAEDGGAMPGGFAALVSAGTPVQWDDADREALRGH